MSGAAFAAALATLHADPNMATDAEWRAAAGGAWRPVRVLLSAPADDVAGLGGPGARASALEATLRTAEPVYAGLLAARQRYLGTLPWVAARHALRGWEGSGLPPFRRVRGLVPDDLLDALPQEDVEAVGWRASMLMQPGQDAAKNSGAPSPSHESPAPTKAA